jgi:hypothetical protein
MKGLRINDGQTSSGSPFVTGLNEWVNRNERVLKGLTSGGT